MTTTRTPTGRQETRAGQPHVVLTREFTAPAADVWAAVTEPDRLARWLGTWTGDPATGHVTFQMLFEGDDIPTEDFRIDECEEPRRLAITTTSVDGDDVTHWHLELDLTENDGVTTLTFAQSVPDPTTAHSAGPGWEYYLDRLVTAETGGDPAAIDFDDYYPVMEGYYAGLFDTASEPVAEAQETPQPSSGG